MCLDNVFSKIYSVSIASNKYDSTLETDVVNKVHNAMLVPVRQTN